MLENDLNNVFFNTDEFAEKHIVDDKEMSIIIDNEKLNELKAKSQYAEYIATCSMLIMVKASDFSYKPAIGQVISIDGDIYRANLVTETGMIYEIALEANY